MSGQERDPRVIEEFKRRQKKQLMVTVPAVLVIVTLIVMGERHPRMIAGLPSSVVTGGFFGLIIVMVIFSFRNWRCPACNGYLGKSFSPRFCPRCGAVLQ